MSYMGVYLFSLRDYVPDLLLLPLQGLSNGIETLFLLTISDVPSSSDLRYSLSMIPLYQSSDFTNTRAFRISSSDFHPQGPLRLSGPLHLSGPLRLSGYAT